MNHKKVPPPLNKYPTPDDFPHKTKNGTQTKEKKTHYLGE